MKAVAAIFTHRRTQYEAAQAACQQRNPWDYAVGEDWDTDESPAATLLRIADTLITTPAQTAQDVIFKIKLISSTYQDRRLHWLAARLQATSQALQAGDFAAAACSFHWFCWQEAALSPHSRDTGLRDWEALIVADIKRVSRRTPRQLFLSVVSARQ